MNSNISLSEAGCLIFHPGIGKTATSTIQNIGLKLATTITEEVCFSPYGIYGGAHNYFASNHPGFNREIFNDQWGKLLGFAKQRNAATVVSSEFLIRDTPKHIGYLINSAIDAGLKVKIIFSIRDYSEYLISAYLQSVKVNWGLKGNESIFDYCAREMDSIRYPQLVDRWSKVVGDENIHIINYGADKPSFVPNFFQAIGVSQECLPAQPIKANPSIPLEMAPIIRQYDAVYTDSNYRSKLITELSSQTCKPEYSETIKQRVKADIVANKFVHDIERLKARYVWVG